MQYIDDDSTSIQPIYDNISLIETSDTFVGAGEVPHLELANRTAYLKNQTDTARSNINDATNQIELNTNDATDLNLDTTTELNNVRVLYTGYNYNFISGFRNYCHSGYNWDNCPIPIESGRCVAYGHPDGTNSGEYSVINLTQTTYQYTTGGEVPPLGQLSYRDEGVWYNGAYYIYILKATDGSISTIASQKYPYPDLSFLETKWQNGYYRRIGSFIRTSGGAFHHHSGALYYESIGKSNNRKILYDEQLYCIGDLKKNIFITKAYPLWKLISIRHRSSEIIYVPKYTVRTALMRYHSAGAIDVTTTEDVSDTGEEQQIYGVIALGGEYGVLTQKRKRQTVLSSHRLTLYFDKQLILENPVLDEQSVGGQLKIRRADSDLSLIEENNPDWAGLGSALDDILNIGYSKSIGRSHVSNGFEVTLDPLSDSFFQFYVRQNKDYGLDVLGVSFDSEEYYFSVLCEGYTEKV